MKNSVFLFVLLLGMFIGAYIEMKVFQPLIKKAQVQPQEEEIFHVVGRVTLTTDGIGSTVGFVIKDGDRFKIARYDKGSSFDNESFQPKFLSRYKLANGEIQYQPFVVTEYK